MRPEPRTGSPGPPLGTSVHVYFRDVCSSKVPSIRLNVTDPLIIVKPTRQRAARRPARLSRKPLTVHVHQQHITLDTVFGRVYHHRKIETVRTLVCPLPVGRTVQVLSFPDPVLLPNLLIRKRWDTPTLPNSGNARSEGERFQPYNAPRPATLHPIG